MLRINIFIYIRVSKTGVILVSWGFKFLKRRKGDSFKIFGDFKTNFEIYSKYSWDANEVQKKFLGVLRV